jgi:hypothetical protein
MRLPKEIIEYLAQTIVHDLLAKGLITIVPEQQEELIGRIKHVITEDLLVEDHLNDEVRELLQEHASDMAKGQVEYQKMFLLVKRRLVRERGLIL